ncbi:hypothetical protein BJV82DRAFT_576101 [Fennellomyces sp. T-0311]|nr:hypothetical protein BJV82DRAFT_576101 [Fennellomyces sp. T-0311]
MSASDEEDITAIINHVTTVAFNQPHKGNSTTFAIMEYLSKVRPGLVTDPDVRVLAFTAVGKYFCTGFGLSGHICRPMNRLCSAWNGFPTIVTYSKTHDYSYQWSSFGRWAFICLRI